MALSQGGTDRSIYGKGWYHGFRPRNDAHRMVRHPGDFVVRAVDSGREIKYFITACDQNLEILDITLRHDDNTNSWFVGKSGSPMPIEHKFPTIVDLVEHYRINPLTKNLQLSKFNTRPHWMIQSDCIFYEERDKLGGGRYYTMHKGQLELDRREPQTVAIKMLSSDADSEDTTEALKALMHEAELLSYYDHSNVIKFYGASCDQLPVMLTMEFCAGGSLLNHLLERGKDTPDREKILYIFEASRGVAYLHNKACVHSYLAASTILISSSGRVKIADFSRARVFLNHVPADLVNNYRTRWTPPESLCRIGSSITQAPVYTEMSDVWTMAVVFFEVFSNGDCPWPEETMEQVTTRIHFGQVPSLPATTPTKIVDITTIMWKRKPADRPDMKQVVCEIEGILNGADSALGAFPPESMSVNRIPGVKREVFFERDKDDNDDGMFDSPKTSRCNHIKQLAQPNVESLAKTVASEKPEVKPKTTEIDAGSVMSVVTSKVPERKMRVTECCVIG